MTVLRRRLIPILGLAGMFCAGWAIGRTSGQRAYAQSAAPVVAPPSSAGGCTDPLAMQANANLVGQVQDYRHQLADAHQRVSEATLKVKVAESGPPGRLLTSREEWARMAREGKIRMRVPCASWSAARHFTVRKRDRGYGSGSLGRAETTRRAEAAGLSPEELETLADAHQRAQARTWSAMRSVCEAIPEYRERTTDDNEELGPQERVGRSQTLVHDMSAATTRTAFTRVAQLRAAGHGSERASGSEEIVAFALSSGPEVLFDEVTRALGRERATRAADNGLLCLDETLYDVREPAEPEEG